VPHHGLPHRAVKQADGLRDVAGEVVAPVVPPGEHGKSQGGRGEHDRRKNQENGRAAPGAVNEGPGSTGVIHGWKISSSPQELSRRALRLAQFEYDRRIVTTPVRNLVLGGGIAAGL